MSTKLTDYTNWPSQRFFNKVAKHLITQNRREKDKNDDIYPFMSESGCRCASGCLLPKKWYKENDYINNFSYHLTNLIFRLVGIFKYDLLCDLTECHESFRPSQWPSRLRSIARQHKLDIPDFLLEHKGTAK